MNKTQKTLVHRKLKVKRNKTPKIGGTETVQLGLEEDEITMKAKHELDQYSSSFIWQPLPNQKTKKQVPELDQWGSYPDDCFLLDHNFGKYRSQTPRKLRVKTEHSQYEFNKSCYKNGKYCPSNNNYESLRSSTNGPSLNLSFKNITTLNSPKADHRRHHHRPSTCKKEVARKIVTVLPYGQNGVFQVKKPRRHLRTESSQEQQIANVLEINGGSLANLAVKGPKMKVSNHSFYSTNNQKLRSSSKRSNLLDHSQTASNGQSLARNYKSKGKWVHSMDPRKGIRRVYKIDSQSPLNHQFEALTKLLKYQLNSFQVKEIESTIVGVK